MTYVLVPLYVLVCVFLILVVLLQQGRGADVAAAFGASSSQTAFGARGATTVLEKTTTWAFVAFSVLAITLSLIQSRPHGSVMGREKGKAATAPKTSLPAPVQGAPAPGAPVQSAPAQSAPAPAPASTK